MSRTPELSEVLNTVLESALSELYISMPGKVVAYDATAQKADVQPLIKVPAEDERGELHREALPVVPSVPVVMPGGGGFVVQFPISVGDTVLLVFSAASLDKWLARGGGPIDPETDQRHTLSDAVAIPGLRDFRHARATAIGMVLGVESGVQIQVNPAEIKLGSAAVDPLILSTPFLAAFATLIGAIATAAAGTGGGVTTAINGALAAFQAAAATYLSAVAKTQ